MENKSLRIAIALRYGAPVCAEHRCVNGATVVVDINGLHGLSCKKSKGRIRFSHYFISSWWRWHIVQRRNTSDVLCWPNQQRFVLCNKLNTIVKLKLFKSYCTSIYGAELWTLDSANIETFCVAWRKALRRILQLPHNSQLPFLLIVWVTLYPSTLKFASVRWSLLLLL